MKLLLFILTFLPFNSYAPLPITHNEIIFFREAPVHLYDFDFQLFKEHIYQKLQHPEICLKQAFLEQGSELNGRFIRERNNIWNFQVYSKKMKDYKVLYFPSPDSCINYYQSFQKRKLRKHENYYRFLERVKFASDKNYIRKLKNIAL